MRKTGSIDTTSNGRHRVRLSLPGQGRKTLGIYDTVEEAETERAAALDVIDTEVPDVDTWTVKTWGERWLNARDVGKLVRDPESDWSRWRNHIEKDPIAKVGLKALRRKHVKAWLERVRAKVARQTAVNTLNVLRGLLGAAVDEEIIKTNPAAGIKLPKQKRTEEPWTYLVPDEQRRIILVADEPERWIIAFAMGTGLRAGELCALRLADVHTKGDEPHVVVRYGGPPNEPTKGGKIRRVPLFGIGLLSANEWLATLPKWAEKNPHRLMFPRLRGGYRDAAHVIPWPVWQDVLEAAGIVRPFRWHDLRHTAGSSLVSGFWGRHWSLVEVRDFLGHESVTTTERYAHLGETVLKKAATETRNAAAQLANTGHDTHRRDPRFPNNLAGSHLRDLNSRPTVYETPEKFLVTIGESGTRGQLLATCEAYLRAVARGDELAHALAAQMGALLVAEPMRAIALAEALVASAAPVVESKATG